MSFAVSNTNDTSVLLVQKWMVMDGVRACVRSCVRAFVRSCIHASVHGFRRRQGASPHDLEFCYIYIFIGSYIAF